MSTDESSVSLRALRDVLRSQIPDVDTFAFHLASTLDALYLGPTSVPPARIPDEVLRAISKLLPGIQVQLLTSAVPNFLHVLDERQRGLLLSFFVPSTTEVETLHMRRSVALVTYLTLPSLLSSSHPQAVSLPQQSRSFIFEILSDLVDNFSIDAIYWSIFSSSLKSRGDGWGTMQWEDAVKALVSLPGKVANAAGLWKEDGWKDDLPSSLVPREYFDRLADKFERLLYELSQTPPYNFEPLRLIVQRLASLGLLRSPSNPSDPTPNLLTSLFPPLLSHLHPAPTSPLPPYPANFLSDFFLGLPTSILANFVDSFLQHIALKLINEEDGALLPNNPDERVKRASVLLVDVIGHPRIGGEAWEAVITSITKRRADDPMRNASQARNRVIGAWVSLGGETAAKSFIDLLLRQWTDPKYIKFTLYSQQLCKSTSPSLLTWKALTHLLVLALSLLPPYHPHLVYASHQSHFLTAMHSYLAHPDSKVRRLGMLVAEIVSELTIAEDINAMEYDPQEDIEELKAGLELDEDGQPKGKKPRMRRAKRLRFTGMWEGQGEGKEEARWLRSAVSVRDQEASLADDLTGDNWLLGWDREALRPRSVPESMKEQPPQAGPSKPRGRALSKVTLPKERPKIVMLDDDQLADPLEGYASISPSSSRSPSPTPSYLEEVAADPSLALDATQNKKLAKPVYIPQLIELLKERDKPDHIEMGLKWGEQLVRAKRSFGTELVEYAPTLATMIIALNDSFNIEGFDGNRQNLLNALVACSPGNVAPYLAEQYFEGQFSLQQRSVLLTALAMGARELAGLVVPNPPTTKRIDFPTKTLPQALHRRYIGPADAPLPIDQQPGQIDEAIDGVRNLLLSKGAKKGEETVPELARGKRLRVGPTRQPKVGEIGSLSERQMAGSSKPSPVVPFKDVAAESFIMPLINRFWHFFRDVSTRDARALVSGQKYRGAGTGMILSPLALEKFLLTLALLVHAGRHSPLFLAVLSPEALEIAVTIGSRHMARPDDLGATSTEGIEGSNREAQVVGAALELALVCLDASVDLDGGRTLAMDKSQVVLAVGEWAQGVFEVENRGGEVAGGQGGMREGRIRAASAGVVVKVAEIGDKWSSVGLLR
ncbi:telomere length regulation protein-domain-containing protein [Naematelia encephala]|uniref:Telomere length regulation protein-domain-containing protein n=1 Tax=Naematelia encephala TaxID=71784 RepID=A0A1Y2BF04_9TREE|nr:telomere length regulation protein-domain-containing protein [Naematelia encephala]